MLRTRRPPRRLGPLARRALVLLALGPCAALAGCGPEGGPGTPPAGTVILENQTDLGMAPLTIEEFYLAPVGDPAPGDNLLTQAVLPGAQVIVGLFPPGTYNAVAVLAGGGQINFPPAEVIDGQPTNFVVP